MIVTPDEPLPRIPCNMDTIAKVASMYGAAVHGDAAGVCDVAFPDVHRAASFFDTHKADWPIALRSGDYITDLDAPVVLSITMDKE